METSPAFLKRRKMNLEKEKKKLLKEIKKVFKNQENFTQEDLEKLKQKCLELEKRTNGNI